MPNGVNRVTGLPFETSNFKSEYSIEDPELKELVNSVIGAKKQHKKKGATAAETTTPAVAPAVAAVPTKA